jgi:hypothetical protein
MAEPARMAQAEKGWTRLGIPEALVHEALNRVAAVEPVARIRV